MTSTLRRRLDASVIVNTYQQAQTIGLVLTALREQDFDGTWEIIVVDDGSRDATAGIVARHAAASPVPVLFVQQADRGNRWSTARNLGTQVSTGQILIFFDGDMIADADAVRRHVEEQQRQPGLLAGNRLWRDPDTDLPADATADVVLRTLRSSTGSASQHQRRREAGEHQWREDLVASNHPWRAWFGCHISVPALPDVTFDEAMIGWGPADIELACRLHTDHELPVRYLADVRAWHLEHDHALHNPFRTYDQHSATEYVWQICYMITKHPGLPLAELMTRGFDRLVFTPTGEWTVVARGDGDDPHTTLAAALAWYAALPLGHKLNPVDGADRDQVSRATVVPAAVADRRQTCLP